LAGVPLVISNLHHACGWNDLDSLERIFMEHEGEIAAVIIAADYSRMQEGVSFYPAVRKLADRHGSLLIFDEIVTGFRIAIGGAQQYFGVVPDLAVFSKGIANGMPLSVYAGREDIMSLCAPGKVTISSTFAGEALSLAAAKASMHTYQNDAVIEHLWKLGETMWSGLQRLFDHYDIPIEIHGLWPCPQFVESEGRADSDTLSRFFRLAYKHGVSLYMVSYVTFSHQDHDIDEALSRLEQVCKEYVG
jgi:glutamate-1-semialdehyde 2,1-aminomutase